MIGRIRAVLGILFKLPTPQELALRELGEARRELMLAMSAQEYAASLVAYNQKRVARLEKLTKS